MFQTKVVEKIKTHILRSITFFFRKLCRLWDNVENYWKARQITGHNIVRCMRFSCWIPKATNTLWQCVIFLAFHSNNGYTNALSVTLYVHCLSCLYGIRTVAVMQAVKIGLKKNLNFNGLEDCFWCLCDRASLIT